MTSVWLIWPLRRLMAMGGRPAHWMKSEKLALTSPRPILPPPPEEQCREGGREGGYCTPRVYHSSVHYIHGVPWLPSWQCTDEW